MKKGTFSTFCFAFLCLLFSTECSIEKRHYKKGFYVTSGRNHLAVKINEKNEPEVKDRKKCSPPNYKITGIQAGKLPDQPIVSASVEKINPPVLVVKKLRLPPDSCGDLITFMNGDELEVKLLEIGPNYIAYLRCDYLTGPLIKTTTDKLFRIKYGDGLVKVFQHDQPSIQQRPGYGPNNKPIIKKTNGLAVSSFVLSIFSFLLFPAPVALILGIISLTQFKNQPEKYTGKWMAVAGTIISGLAIGLFVLSLFL